VPKKKGNQKKADKGLKRAAKASKVAKRYKKVVVPANAAFPEHEQFVTDSEPEEGSDNEKDNEDDEEEEDEGGKNSPKRAKVPAAGVAQARKAGGNYSDEEAAEDVGAKRGAKLPKDHAILWPLSVFPKGAKRHSKNPLTRPAFKATFKESEESLFNAGEASVSEDNDDDEEVTEPSESESSGTGTDSAPEKTRKATVTRKVCFLLIFLLICFPKTCILHVFYMYFPCISHVFYKTCISHVFPMYFACISHVFFENMYFACISHVFPMYFLKTCISHVFPMY
jgi:hypothetical protein